MLEGNIQAWGLGSGAQDTGLALNVDLLEFNQNLEFNWEQRLDIAPMTHSSWEHKTLFFFFGFFLYFFKG